jgi:hypothetical protein
MLPQITGQDRQDGLFGRFSLRLFLFGQFFCPFQVLVPGVPLRLVHQ